MRSGPIFVGIALLSVLGMLLSGCRERKAESEDPIVARVAGETLRLSEVERRAGWRLHRARLDVHFLLERETDRLIEERLLERTARERGTDVESLLRETVADVGAVSEAEVDRYLEEHPTDVSIETARPRIRLYLEETRRIERRLTFVAALRDAADVEILLTPPPRPRIVLELRDAPSRGPDDAPISIVHFADLSRSDTARSASDLARLEREFPGKIRAVHRNLPVDRDELGLRTAQLAAAAEVAGSFWSLHDRLVASGGVQSPAELEAIARAVDLEDRLAGLNEDGDSLLRVRRDVELADQAGVRRAPTLFVNGRYVSGLDGYEALRELLQEELAATSLH